MIRAETRAALASAMRAPVEALGATLYTWPEFRDPLPTRVTIVSTPVEGDLTVPVYGSGRVRWTDTWRYVVVCRAEAQLQSAATAEALVQSLAEAAILAVHTNTQLSGLSKSAGTAGTWRFLKALVVRIDGPEIDATDQGAAALCNVHIECLAEIF